jgi:hypothetical protein
VFRSLILLLLLQVFGNASDPSLDKTAPSVTISSPTSSTTYDAGTASTVSNIAGTSTDTSGIAICRWVNSLGGSGTANTSATGVWTIPTVSLTVGSNVLTVTCLDPGNNQGTDILTITRSAVSSDCGTAGCIYVDNDCGTPGNGSLDVCDSSGNGQMSNLQTAMNAATAGEVIVLHEGADYVTSNGSSYTDASGFAFTTSGTSGNPIVLRNATGERPVLRACASSATTVAACNRPTITAFGQSYIKITSADCSTDITDEAALGLHIYGMVDFYDDGGATESLLAIGNEISCTEIERGWAPLDDNNWSGIFFFNQYICTITRNYIHDIEVETLTGEGSQASRSAIKTFTGTNCTISSNTIDAIEMSTATQNGIAWDCKADCVNNIFEKNKVTNVAMGMRLENQETPGGPYTTNGATGSVVHFNLFTNDGSVLWECLGFEDGKITSYTFHNNTCAGFNEGLGNNNHVSSTICAGGSIYNNAFYGIVDNNLKMGGGAVGCQLTLSNYNRFTTGATSPRFQYASTTYAALANWQTLGFDANSTEGTNASFLFTDPTNGDYTLQALSPLQSAGRVGGSGATTVDIGAYTDDVTVLGCNCDIPETSEDGCTGSTILHVGSGQTYSTISAAETAATTGNTICVHSGTYTEQIEISVNSLTIQNNAGDSPVITGDIDFNATSGGTVTCNRGGGRMEVTGWGTASAGAAGIVQIGGSGLTITGCYIHDGFGAGVYSRNSTDILVEDTEITGALPASAGFTANGISMLSCSSTDSTYGNGCRATDNEIYENSVDGMAINGEHFTISGNYIHDNILSNYLTTHPDGIQVIDVVQDGFPGAVHLKVFNNVIKNHTQNLFLEGDSAGGTGDALIYNNVFYSDATSSTGIDMDAAAGKNLNLKGMATAPVYVFNNTFGRWSGSDISTTDGLDGAITVKNNLFKNAVSSGMNYPNSADFASGGLNYNAYDITTASADVTWNGVGYASLAAFKAAVPTMEINGFEGTILLNAFPTPTLQSGSIAIDTGLDVSGIAAELAFDAEGDTRTGAWDIGAFEF